MPQYPGYLDVGAGHVKEIRVWTHYKAIAGNANLAKIRERGAGELPT